MVTFSLLRTIVILLVEQEWLIEELAWRDKQQKENQRSKQICLKWTRSMNWDNKLRVKVGFINAATLVLKIHLRWNNSKSFLLDIEFNKKRGVSYSREHLTSWMLTQEMMSLLQNSKRLKKLLSIDTAVKSNKINSFSIRFKGLDLWQVKLKQLVLPLLHPHS